MEINPDVAAEARRTHFRLDLQRKINPTDRGCEIKIHNLFLPVTHLDWNKSCSMGAIAAMAKVSRCHIQVQLPSAGVLEAVRNRHVFILTMAILAVAMTFNRAIIRCSNMCRWLWWWICLTRGAVTRMLHSEPFLARCANRNPPPYLRQSSLYEEHCA